MVDNANSTTNKRKQPERETSESAELKRSKTDISDDTVNSKHSDDKNHEDGETPDDEQDNVKDGEEDEDEEDEDDQDEEGEGEDEGEDDENENENEEIPQNTKNTNSSSSSSSKAGSSKQAAELSDHDDDNISDDELEALDTSLIINTGRRTRGKKIDYTQFGADTPADEE